MNKHIGLKVMTNEIIKEAKENWGYEPAPDWRDRAHCKGLGPRLFFMEPGESTYPAVSVCWECPVRLDCLYDCLGEKIGIFGGLGQRARMGMRKWVRTGGAEG